MSKKAVRFFDSWRCWHTYASTSRGSSSEVAHGLCSSSSQHMPQHNSLEPVSTLHPRPAAAHVSGRTFPRHAALQQPGLQRRGRWREPQAPACSRLAVPPCLRCLVTGWGAGRGDVHMHGGLDEAASLRLSSPKAAPLGSLQRPQQGLSADQRSSSGKAQEDAAEPIRTRPCCWETLYMSSPQSHTCQS